MPQKIMRNCDVEYNMNHVCHMPIAHVTAAISVHVPPTIRGCGCAAATTPLGRKRGGIKKKVEEKVARQGVANYMLAKAYYKIQFFVHVWPPRTTHSCIMMWLKKNLPPSFFHPGLASASECIIMSSVHVLSDWPPSQLSSSGGPRKEKGEKKERRWDANAPCLQTNKCSRPPMVQDS